MATPTQVVQEPYRKFRFLVEIDGLVSAGFSEVSGLKAEHGVSEYAEGGENTTSRKLPGRTKFNPVTLKRGHTFNEDLWNWFSSIHKYGGTPATNIVRKTVTIVLIGHEGKRLEEWVLNRTWPSSFEIDTLNAMEDGVLSEIVTLQHEGISKPTTPIADDVVSM